MAWAASSRTFVEDMGVAPERHGRVGVPEHLGDRVYGDTLAYGQGGGGVAEVVEADLAGETGLLEEALEAPHDVVAPADLADRVGEDEAVIGPLRAHGHPLVAYALEVGLQDGSGAGTDADGPLLAGLRGGDDGAGPGVGGAVAPDGRPVGRGEVYVLSPEGGQLPLAHASAQCHHHQGLVAAARRGRHGFRGVLVGEGPHGPVAVGGGLLHAGGGVLGDEAVVHGLVECGAQHAVDAPHGVRVEALVELLGLQGTHVTRGKVAELAEERQEVILAGPPVVGVGARGDLVAGRVGETVLDVLGDGEAAGVREQDALFWLAIASIFWSFASLAVLP